MTSQVIAKALEETKEKIKILSLAIVGLKNEVEAIKIAQGKSSGMAFLTPHEMSRSSLDWGTISEEAILGTDPLILPTNTSRETLHLTIEALKDNPDGATADEISQITGRARNTESAYLRRLHLAGKLDKVRDKRTTKYKLIHTI